MSIRIAKTWFEFTRIDDNITLIREPFTDPLIRCNIWHVKGGDMDLLIDTGLGIASLQEAAKHLFEKPILAVATHTHFDHVGGLHEFDNRVVHPLEASELDAPVGFAALTRDGLGPEMVRLIENTGYPLPDLFVTAIPEAGFDIDAYKVRAAPAVRKVVDGDIIDIGTRRLEVLHLPGHSPGSIGLWEAATGTLFSGDAIYDGPLIDNIPGSNIPDYVTTMQRLMRLPVTVVHGGHDESFGRDRFRQIASDYLRQAGAKHQPGEEL